VRARPTIATRRWSRVDDSPRSSISWPSVPSGRRPSCRISAPLATR
jgi:hypothetical protein